MADFIEVDGLIEFEKSLTGLRADIRGLSSDVTLDAATEVIDAARPLVPQKSGKASRTLRAFQQGTDALAEGGDGIDYYAWLEFGGASGRKHANVRPKVTEGRYLVPGFRIASNNIQALMEKVLKRYVEQNKLDMD